jgi:hypothetical protein
MSARHTTVIVVGSCGLTPKSSDRSHEAAPSPSGTAAATPAATGSDACRNIIRRTAPRSAPSAKRIPISVVRYTCGPLTRGQLV